MSELHDFQTTLALVNDRAIFQINTDPLSTDLYLSITEFDGMGEKHQLNLLVHKEDLITLINNL